MKTRLSTAAILVALTLPAMSVAAVAQQPPPPPAAAAPEAGPGAGAEGLPPPAPDARPDRGSPYAGMRGDRHGRHWRRGGPRQGAEFTIRQDDDGTDVRVRCAANEPMQACADIVMMILDRVGAPSEPSSQPAQ